MTSRVIGWLLVSLGCACFGGCKSDEADAISRADLPARYAELLCGSLAPCCRQVGFAFNAANCKAEVAADLERNWSEYDSTEVSYDAQAAGDCLAAFTLECGRSTVDEDDVPACSRVFQGKLVLGQACESDTECKGSSNGSVACEEDGTFNQVCTASSSRTDLTHAKAGEACALTCEAPGSCSDFVSPGDPVPGAPTAACYRSDKLYCGFGSTCKPLVGIGQACENYGACAGNAFCDNPGVLGAQGVCTAPRPDGDPCQGYDECQSGYCKETGVCGKRTVDADTCSVGM